MPNIDFLTRYVDHDGSIDDAVLDIDEDLTNICWLPIPDCVIEPDDWDLFWKLWNEQKTPMSSDKDSAVWDSLCIWKSPHIDEVDVAHSLYPQPITDWSLLFPKMFASIFNAMPYSEVWKVTLGSNINRVPLHVDPPRWGTETHTSARHGTLNPWPNSLRVMLKDDNIQPTFYLSPWDRHLIAKGKIADMRLLGEWGTLRESLPEDRCYVNLPANTNTFVFSNGEFMHGADYANKQKLLILVWGQPDTERWKAKLREIKSQFKDDSKFRQPSKS